MSSEGPALRALGDLENADDMGGQQREEQRYERYFHSSTIVSGESADSSDEEGGRGIASVGGRAQAVSVVGGFDPESLHGGEGDFGVEEEKVEDSEEEDSPGDNLYAALEDDDFGEFVGPDSADAPDDDAMFTKVLANLEMRDQRPTSVFASVEEGLFDDSVLRDVDKADPSVDASPVRISIPPLTVEKRAAIKQAMLKFPMPKPRPGAEMLVDSIIKSYNEGLEKTCGGKLG